MSTIYFVAGASGSGKSAIAGNLEQLLGSTFSVFDFDDIGVPDDADKKWRQKATEQWLEKLLKEKKNAVLLGQMVLGEILACPLAQKLGTVNFCLLDVSDIERVKRLKKRNTYGIDQNSLNWASWLRMHHEDPQWQQQVIKDNCWSELNFSRWDSFDNWSSLAQVKIIDTTGLSISEVASAVKLWIEG